MRIITCVKQVPDTYEARRIGPDNRVVRSGGEQVCDEITERIVTLARTLRGKSDEIVAVTMGPEKARKTVRHALAMGADRGIHICDPALAGADQLVTATVLAAMAERETWQLILTGMVSSDGGGRVYPRY